MKKAFLFLGVAAFAATSHLEMVHAQSIEDDTGTVSETDSEARLGKIIISGRKKEETLLSAPISVSAFSAETLQNFGAISARDIADLTPGLQIAGDFGRQAERPVIRGISNLRTETAQPVGLFIDGVFVRSGLISEILDNTERVEVLKGPQGALYGRSTYGGVINYITKKPGDEFEANFSATIAEHDQYEFSARLAGPLANGLSGVIGARYYEYGGEYDNLNPNTSGARDVGSEETKAFYGGLNFQPPKTPELEANIRVYRSEDSDGQFVGQLFDSTFNNSGPAGGTACPEVIRSFFCGTASTREDVNIATSVNTGDIVSPFFGGIPAEWDFKAGLDREITRLTGDVNYEFSDNISLTYQGGFTTEDNHTVTNQSYSETIVGNSFGSFPSAWVTDDILDRSYWSHEARINWEITDQIDFLAGVFVYDEESAGVDRNIIQANYGFDGERSNEEKAVFAGLDIEVTDALSLGFEGRAYEEDVSVVTAVNNARGRELSTSFDGTTWRLTADYQFPNDVLLYGSISTGNKAGGFNTNVDPDDPDEAFLSSFDEELATQYELGLKGRLLDDRLRFSGAVYRIDLTDQQLSQVVVLREGTPDQVQVTVVLNAGETEINGFELDGQFDVTDSLTLAAAWSTSDSEITEGEDPSIAATFGSTSIVGKTVPRVSKDSGTVSAQLRLPAIGNWEPNVRVDGIYASSRFGSISNLTETGESFKTNARLSLGNEDHGTEITLWGRNLFDDDTPANVFQYVDPGDFRFFARSHVVFLPRGPQFGLTLRTSF